MKPDGPLALARTAADGTWLYLSDDPDGCYPRAIADPFRARPFPDRAAIAAYLAAHPAADRPGVRVVPWPIDLDRAVHAEAPAGSDRSPAPADSARRAGSLTREPMELFR